MRERTPTSADVADAAGVSRATVSYVLNGRQDVRITEATREQVLAAARTLGYQPSPAARALRAGQGQVVLVLTPEWAAGEFGDVVADLGRLVERHGLVCLRHEGAQWKGNLGDFLARVTAAAVITLEPLLAADAETLGRAGIPEIRFWLLDEPQGKHTTAIDQSHIVRLQVEHLLERGYRRLAYLAVPKVHPYRVVEARIHAFKEACSDLGLRSAMVAVEPQELEAVVTRLRAWTRRSGKPLGICAWSDDTALAALSAARALELDVPGQLGVIGVDDTSEGRLSLPALTSIRLNLEQEAALVAHNIAQALRLPAEEERPSEEPMALVQRASS